ncbi:LabA-like NYN domain-containing protein [Sansalvadorimonas verongulae]|uniref:LabA-like NYN domain-containing protein n=1 Tax=Sansalvadorimonas verongulae TaxID=2172824 RepID=UPI0012BC8184|nr:NYN domain-containing protein [Sansalvadorimonas verongulae]MTI12124.1 NYN domain-containing protein [Sansalvadorimonas verongulae]
MPSHSCDKERVTILVDVQNIYYTTRQIYKCNFDFNAFWAQATAGRSVVKAVAYAVDRGDEKQRQFQNILRAIGFEVKLKPYIQRADGSAKGDWDVGITLDAVEYADESDAVVLASGDGDFGLLVEKLKSKYGVSVDVYGVQALTAASLIHVATRYIPVEGNLLLRR